MEGSHDTARDAAAMPPECARLAPWLEAFHDGALPAEQARTLTAHSAGCAACAARLEQLTVTDRLIAAAPLPAPGQELRQRVSARIAAARRARPARTARVAAALHHWSEDSVNDNSSMDTPRVRVSAPAHGRGLWTSTFAAIVVVALLAGMFLTHGRGGVAHGTPPPAKVATSGHVTFAAPAGACAVSAIKAQLPPHAYLSDLAMVSPDEGWAVGDIRDAQDDGPINTLVMHYRNCVWSVVPTNYPDMQLAAISMDSPGDGWAVGGATSGATQLALHYTGGAWHAVTLPGQNGLHGVYSSVRMLSDGEGWVVVTTTKNAQGKLANTLVREHGGAWSPVTPPFGIVTDLLPVSPTEAWVAGFMADGAQGPLLQHYQNGTWTSVTLPPSLAIDRLRMVSPANIWASGHVAAPTNWDPDQSSAVLHYDGMRWQPVPIGARGAPQLVDIFSAGAGVAFSLANQTGLNGTGFYIASAQYENRGQWAVVPWADTNLWSISGLQRVSQDEYWAIGRYEVSVANNNGGISGTAHPVLLYFANGIWTEFGK
ncbi:MAG: anti-sigma factor family protein [Ktedonobacterales bacterium]